MSDAKSLCRTALLALVASTMLLVGTDARAGGCKANGQVCSTDISCCSRDCAKPIAKKSSRPAMFGLCCPSGSNALCGANGTTCVNLKTDPNNCGSCGNACDASQCQTCMSGVCGSACQTGQVCSPDGCCTPATSCPAGQTCGTASNGCGGTINCGTCTAPETCGGGGMPGVCGCTPATSCPAGQTCGTASDGCGGMLNCGTCGQCQTCTGNACVSVADNTSCGFNGAICCGGTCYTRDPNNCGTCGNVCPLGTTVLCQGSSGCCQDGVGPFATCNTTLTCCTISQTCTTSGFCCLENGTTFPTSCHSNSECCSGFCNLTTHQCEANPS
jgi:hypothetical protein